MSRFRSTRIRTNNSAGIYPCLTVLWDEDEDCLGWTGSAEFWDDSNTKTPQETKHTIQLRQSSPLGTIFVSVDGLTYGCWSMATFDGDTLTERDLQWATVYAIEALKRKRIARQETES